MKLKFRLAISRKRIRRLIGLMILAAPFFILLGVLEEKEIQTMLSRPYWQSALGERAKQVPQYKEEKETTEEIRGGTLSDLPLYHLYIKPNTLAELDELLPVKKEHEPNLRFLPQSARIYKPAFFEYKGIQRPVRIRFRGDSAFHWLGNKQSWRIKFPKDATFEGARRIDLINPKAANFLIDYLTMWLAQRMGLLAPNIKFVNLKINHKLMGVYQQTEHIDKYFLENHGRPVGNIYGEKDKKPKWYDEYPLYTDVVFWRKHCENETQAPNDYTEMSRFIQVLNDPSDEVFVENIFDIVDKEKFYRWNCHALLCSSGHQDWFHNARLYFDPIRGLFEFIPWDLSGFWLTRGFFFDTPQKVFKWQYNPVSSRVLRHGPFRYERDCILWNYVKDPGLLDAILDEAESKRAEIRTSVYNDSLKELIGATLNREGFTNEQFEESSENLKRVTRITFNRIRDALQFNDLNADVVILRPEDHQAGPEGTALAKLGLVTSAPSAVVLRNISLPVEPRDVATVGPSVSLDLFEDTNDNHRFDSIDRRISLFEWDGEEGAFFCGDFRAFVYPKLNEEVQPISTRKDYFIVRTDSADTIPFNIGLVKIRAENAVTGERIESAVQMVDENLDGMDIPMPKTIDEFQALYPDLLCSIAGGKRIVLDPGEHRIGETLVIPEAAILEIPAGACLKFGAGCSLMCYGRLEARGTPDAPVRFTSGDPQKGWGVVALWRAGADGSVLDYCVVEDGGEARIHGGYFSGALSAYYATVKVRDCLFRNNNGDDAVNCKYADGTVSRCVFNGNAADALDFDYCGGTITNNRIISSGNDGIDCGTASPLIMGNSISSCGDKGISLGEESRPLIINNVIRDCTIGIASKDMSDPVIINNVILDNSTGISLYRKKQKYPGGGRGLIMNSIIWGGKNRIKKDVLSGYKALNCSIEGGAAVRGNCDVRPDFIRPVRGNYLLRDGSSLLKAGMDPGENARKLLGLSGDEFPIGLARPLKVPEWSGSR